MLLDKPAVKSVIGLDQIISKAESELVSAGRREFELVDARLIYNPFWSFSFDALVEEHNEEGVVSLTTGVSKKAVLDAHTGKLNVAILDVVLNFSIPNQNEPTDQFPFDVIPLTVTLDEAKKGAVIKAAAMTGASKENVAVSGFRAFYWPVWQVVVKSDGEDMNLVFDAATGVLISEHSFSGTSSDWGQAISSTASDLKNPLNWVKYLVTGLGLVFASVVWFFKKLSGRETGSDVLVWLFTTLRGFITFFIFVLLLLFAADKFGFIKFFS
ncbi:MAG: hypothetical protein J7K00_03515 [Candidatus Diapherotrites archaeon]|nr:hypothetical protein [Candidatus Diapherotrites archaeon]